MFLLPLAIFYSPPLCLDLSVPHSFYSALFYNQSLHLCIPSLFLHRLFSSSVSLFSHSSLALLLPFIHHCSLSLTSATAPQLPYYPFFAEPQSPILFLSLHAIILTLSFVNPNIFFFLYVIISSLSTCIDDPPLFAFSFSTPNALSLLFSVSLRPADVFTPQTTSCCWRSMKACSRPPFRPSSPGELPHFKRKWIILWNEWRHVRQWQTVMHTLSHTHTHTHTS